jgi:3-hydroxyacyl-[acyl-carrier-protein] dehydratase
VRLEYFSMIDAVTALDAAAGSLTALATVPDASPVFEGHFPGHPLVPGVLLIETMAQASGYLILARGGFARMPFLAQVKEAKLRQFVEPAARLSITATLIGDGQGYAVTRTAISVDDKKIADAELTFRVLDFPAAALKDELLARARAIGLVVPA